MKLEKIVYIAEARIEFTKNDIRILSDAACSHYDFKCRSLTMEYQFHLSGADGLLTSLKNQAKMCGGRASRCFTTTELDLFMKVMENNPTMMATTAEAVQQYDADRAAISTLLSETFKKLNDEYRRLNPL